MCYRKKRVHLEEKSWHEWRQEASGDQAGYSPPLTAVCCETLNPEKQVSR